MKTEIEMTDERARQIVAECREPVKAWVMCVGMAACFVAIFWALIPALTLLSQS